MYRVFNFGFVSSSVAVAVDGGYGLASDVLLYVPFTDADASTGADGYVKSSGGHTLTTDVFARAGNAVINTDQTKMDSSSTAAYNPAGANSDGWELDSTISAGLEVGSSSPLSIQFWFYCLNDGSGSSSRLLGWDGWHTSGSGIEFETLSTDYDRFIFYEHTGGTTSRRSIGDHVLNANAWNHIYWAFQPSGSSYLGINGTVTEASGSYITDFAPTVDLNLLKTPANADDAVKGYVQEFIVKNTVPYTANFTPSTTPLVSSGGGGATLSTPTLLGTTGPTSYSRTSTSIDISSATQGALLIASVTTRSLQQNLSNPTEGGWTLLSTVDNGNSSSRPLSRVYYKAAGASESTVTWTHDSDYTSAVAIEIVGADTSTLAVTTGYQTRVFGVVTVPAGGIAIAVHAKGSSSNTSASAFKHSDGSTATDYTILGDAYGNKRSGTCIAWGDVGAGDTNGTDYSQGAGQSTSTATHHIAIKPA